MNTVKEDRDSKSLPKSYLYTVEGVFDSDKEEEETDEEKEEDSDVGSDINKEDGTVSDDDLYLEPFQRRSVRRKFKKVKK